MRTLAELVVSADSAWPLVQQWIGEAKNDIRVLDASDAARRDALVRLQVTTRSPMGAIVYETGGILMDGGWMRILGSGHPDLPRRLPDWNAGKTWIDPSRPPPLLLVADDVVGGFFAVNGGGLAGAPGSVHYFAPDTLAWQDLELSYSQFLTFCFTGDLDRFYEDSRWSGWREEIADIGGERGISIYPFLWAEGPPIAERSRRPVPIEELWSVQQDILAQMTNHKR